MKSVVRTLQGQDSPQFIPLDQSTPTTTLRKVPAAADSPALSSSSSFAGDHEDERSLPTHQYHSNRDTRGNVDSAMISPSQGVSEDLDPAFAPLTPDPFFSPDSTSNPHPTHGLRSSINPFQLPLSAQHARHGVSSRATSSKHFLQMQSPDSQTAAASAPSSASHILRVDDNPFAPVPPATLLQQKSEAHFATKPASMPRELSHINSDSVLVVKPKEKEKEEEIDDLMVPIDFSKRSFGCEVRDPNAPLHPDRNRIMGMMAGVIVGALIIMIVVPLLVVYLK